MIKRKDIQVKERGDLNFIPFLQDSTPLEQIEWEKENSHLEDSDKDKDRCRPEIHMVWTMESRAKIYTKQVIRIFTNNNMLVQWVLKGHLYRACHSKWAIILTIWIINNSQRILLSLKKNNEAFNQSTNASSSWQFWFWCSQVTWFIRLKYRPTRSKLLSVLFHLSNSANLKIVLMKSQL